MRRVLLQGVIALSLAGELFAAPSDAATATPAAVAPAPAVDPLASWSADDRQRAAENLNYINAVLQDLIKRRDDPAIKDNVLMYRCLGAYVNKARGIGSRCGAILRGEKKLSATDPADKVFTQSRAEAKNLSTEAKGCLGNPDQSPLAIAPANTPTNVSNAAELSMPAALVPERAPFASPVY